MTSLKNQFEQITQPLQNRVFLGKRHSKPSAIVIVQGENNKSALHKSLKGRVPDWQIQTLENSSDSAVKLSGQEGPLWVLRPYLSKKETRIEECGDEHSPSEFGLGRDVIGDWWQAHKSENFKAIQIEFLKASRQLFKGAMAGIYLADYNFKEVATSKNQFKTQFYIQAPKDLLQAQLVKEAECWSVGMNISRHLTNLPAGDLNPKTFAEVARLLFKNVAHSKIEVLEGARLVKEKMGLLIGVGRASEEKPRLVHIKYRPAGAAKSAKPMVFVGKGITFDTGGLDIKPSSGMRYMKKDMSGAGTVLGLAYFVTRSKLKKPFDFYLSLAENSVSEKSVRPGDILTSRSGLTVEIHNTDAEGRLVLADALDYAVTRKGKDEPSCVIDVATLTGAMRVALGLEVAGFFSTDARLSKKLLKCSSEIGEPAWQMPLFKPYEKQLKSSFADISNAGDIPFGSTISAALFLKKFVKDVPWAHFDVMSWSHSASGALTEGGNAQAYQTLAQLAQSS